LLIKRHNNGYAAKPAEATTSSNPIKLGNDPAKLTGQEASVGKSTFVVVEKGFTN